MRAIHRMVKHNVVTTGANRAVVQHIRDSYRITSVHPIGILLEIIFGQNSLSFGQAIFFALQGNKSRHPADRQWLHVPFLEIPITRRRYAIFLATRHFSWISAFFASTLWKV